MTVFSKTAALTTRQRSKSAIKKAVKTIRQSALTTKEAKSLNTWDWIEDLLIVLMDPESTTWPAIAKCFPGHSPHDCRQRFYSLGATNTGRWSKLEILWLLYALHLTKAMGRGRALLVARVVGTRSYRQVMSKVAALKKKGPVVELTSEPAEATEEQKAAIHEAQYQAPTMLSGTTNLRTTWADVTVDDVDAFLSEMPLWDEAVPSTVDTSGVVSTTSTMDDLSMYDIGFQEPCAQENVASFETATPVHVATGSADDVDTDWLWKAVLSSRHALHVA